MAEYKTEQKKILLDFLQKNSDRAYTIEEIMEELSGKGSTVPGRSTVYRLMTRLVAEKKVHKAASDSGRQFAYRCTSHEECKHHLHLQCMSCGKVMHLDRQTSEGVLNGVRTAEGFDVSETDTVLLGRCAVCKKAGTK